MRFENGTSRSPVTGVLDVEFCHDSCHEGRVVLKKSTKWAWVLSEPSVPGTRGIRMGARSLPVWMLKSSPGEGMLRRSSSVRAEEGDAESIARRMLGSMPMIMVSE